MRALKIYSRADDAYPNWALDLRKHKKQHDPYEGAAGLEIGKKNALALPYWLC
jgi:hypothetical protein